MGVASPAVDGDSNHSKPSPLDAVVAEHVFYNDSSLNGKNVAASVQDDNAIAPNSLPAGFVSGAAGNTALLGAVPMGSISNVTVVSDGNYDSFPGITSLPNGELIVVYRFGTSHVSVGATIDYTVSTTAEKPGLPHKSSAPPAGTSLEDRDAEITTLANGSVMVSFSSTTIPRKTRTRTSFPGRIIPRPAR